MVEAREIHIRLRAKDVMTSPVITVRPDTSIKDVAGLMLTHHISGLPVVTSDGELVGIVTEADLLYKETGPWQKDERALKGFPPFGKTVDAVKKASGLTAADLMSSPVVTVDEETLVHEIAGLMVRRKINRVPVVRGGRVVGIVSRADVLRALVRPDGEIAAAVRQALVHELWVDVSKVRIDVRQGVVYLDGEVDRRSEKALAERWVATVDGVTKVESSLTYTLDDRRIDLEPSRLQNWRRI